MFICIIISHSHVCQYSYGVKCLCWRIAPLAGIIFYLFIFKHILSLLGYLDVLMYVPTVYGFLPEINVFVFVTFV